MELNKFCKHFREEVLQITLKEMENRTGINLKTLSAFEHGRSTNINHLISYYKICDEDQKLIFEYNFFKYMG